MNKDNIVSLIVYFSGNTSFRIFDEVDKTSIRQNQQYLYFDNIFYGVADKTTFMNDKVEGWKTFKKREKNEKNN